MTASIRSTREVTLTVESTHTYVIPDTVSDEEAIGIAEGMLNDGDQGDVEERIVVESDAYEIEEGQ